jgi:hypothetical protein
LTSACCGSHFPNEAFDTGHCHPCHRIAIGKALCPPALDDCLTSGAKRAAIELFLSTLDDTPINGTAQRAIIRVITFPEDLVRAAADLADIGRKLETPINFGIDTVD